MLAPSYLPNCVACSTGRSGDGPATREHQQKLVKVAKRATAFTRKKKKRLITTQKKKRLMTTQFRHHRAKLNRESVINMNHNKRILRLIERSGCGWVNCITCFFLWFCVCVCVYEYDFILSYVFVRLCEMLCIRMAAMRN